MDQDYKKKLPRIFFFLAAIIIMVKVIRDQNESIITNHITGQTMGTIPYSIKYKTDGAQDWKNSVDSLLVAFNQSLSTYIPDSEISRFNKNDTLVYDSEMFYPVLQSSKEVFDATEGAFDPTIGPLVNAWGFGPEKKRNVLSQRTIDSLLSYVDFSRIDFNSQYAIKPTGMYLDFSAIAKGYAIDLIVDFLVDNGITEYMIEIGGEVAVKGTNDNNEPWSIGLEDPLVAIDESKLMAISRVENRAMATSGNYRNYFEEEGKLFAHIIDPRSGRSHSSNMLSTTVFAPDCMTADAYATAFMVLGQDASMAIVNDNQDLEALFVFQNDTGVAVTMTEGLKEYITLMPQYK